MSSAAADYIIMTATPMSMHVIDDFSLVQTKFVIQSHVIVMFLPSLFTPNYCQTIWTLKNDDNQHHTISNLYHNWLYQLQFK